MMVDTSFIFYKNNVPFEFPQVFEGKWDSGSKTAITATPYTGHVLFINEMRFWATGDLAFSVGTMTIKHSAASGSNQYLEIVIADAEALLGMASEFRGFQFPASTYNVQGVIKFDPPVKLRQTTGQTMTISETTLTVAGSIWMSLHGWSMTETDYDEVT